MKLTINYPFNNLFNKNLYISVFFNIVIVHKYVLIYNVLYYVLINYNYTNNNLKNNIDF